ncbi:MAG: hypothetical protein R3F35_11670 [Myxococcota bacterium]
MSANLGVRGHVDCQIGGRRPHFRAQDLNSSGFDGYQAPEVPLLEGMEFNVSGWRQSDIESSTLGGFDLDGVYVFDVLPAQVEDRKIFDWFPAASRNRGSQ